LWTPGRGALLNRLPTGRSIRRGAVAGSSCAIGSQPLLEEEAELPKWIRSAPLRSTGKAAPTACYRGPGFGLPIVLTTTLMIMTIIGTLARASAPPATIPVRSSTRAELQRLKSSGRSYDEVIRGILEALEEKDPWLQEMEQRIKGNHSGKVKLEPIESLYAKYKSSRSRRGR
jgi:hypothetical protein